MKEKVAGIISILGVIGWGIFEAYIIFEGGINFESLLTFFPILLPAASIILYVIWTKLGKSELQKMDEKIQILKQQIEQKKLKIKLEE